MAGSVPGADSGIPFLYNLGNKASLGESTVIGFLNIFVREDERC